jgi:hypothetical protein
MLLMKVRMVLARVEIVGRGVGRGVGRVEIGTDWSAGARVSLIGVVGVGWVDGGGIGWVDGGGPAGVVSFVVDDRLQFPVPQTIDTATVAKARTNRANPIQYFFDSDILVALSLTSAAVGNK